MSPAPFDDAWNVPPPKEDDDHWPGIEIDQLRDDVESAEMGEAVARQKQSRAEDCSTIFKNRYNDLKKTFDSKMQESNGELSKKCMVYLSLINEYETIVAMYAGHHSIKLSTTNIINLRKRGGLPV
jgi:hypothetical protein